MARHHRIPNAAETSTIAFLSEEKKGRRSASVCVCKEVIQTLSYTPKKQNFEAEVENQFAHLARVLVQAPIGCGMICTERLNQNTKQRPNAVLVVRKVDEALCDFCGINRRFSAAHSNAKAAASFRPRGSSPIQSEITTNWHAIRWVYLTGPLNSAFSLDWMLREVRKVLPQML